MKTWFYRRLMPGHQYPFFLFGRFICVHSGKWADIRLPRTWLVVNWRRGYAYLSKDGTPNKRTWGIGDFREY